MLKVEKFKNINIYTNYLMEKLGEEPIYTLKIQCRDLNTGIMRLFTRQIVNRKHLRDEKLETFLQEKLQEFIEEKEASGYMFVEFERAIYDFPNKKKGLKTWQWIKFFDKDEEEMHKAFLNYERKKYIQKGEM